MSCILAIGDRPIYRQFLVCLLGCSGHEVLEASDGEQALAILHRSRPDLVITDIKMPDMDSYAFVDRLRQEAVTAATPVIFYSASYHEREVRQVAESCGMADIITKPSEPEEILRKVNAALGMRGLLAQHRFRGIGAVQRRELELQATGLKLAALVELGMEFGFERDVTKLLGRFCSTARRIIGARKSMLAILSENGDELKHLLINGVKDAKPTVRIPPPIRHPALEAIVKARKAVRINGGASDMHLEQLSRDNLPIQSFLGVPLMRATKVYGWLALLEKEDGNFGDDDERLALTLAAQAAIAYENTLCSELLQRSVEELDKTRREQLVETGDATRAMAAASPRWGASCG